MSDGQRRVARAIRLLVGFGSLFPVLFLRYSRGLWLAFDHIFDPVEDQGLGDGDAKGW